jgi:hypothetical protein
VSRVSEKEALAISNLLYWDFYKMVIKLDPKLLREPVADTGLTHGWVVNILAAYDDSTVVQSVSKNGVTPENVIKGVLTLLITHYKKN